MLPLADRRHFLRLLSQTGLAMCGGGVLAVQPARGADDRKYQLKPAQHDLFRARTELSVKGNIHLPRDPVRSKDTDRQLQLESKSILDFEERLTRSDKGSPQAARRYYYEATSEATVGSEPLTASLRDSLKRLTARRANGPEVLYSEEEFLTHEELDLLQSPISSLAVDQLLPTDDLARGDTWTLEDFGLARVLNLDAVQKSTVTGALIDIDDAKANLQFKGRIDGAVEGVPTAIDLAGKLTFDRKRQAITWVALALREKREIGIAKPGFEVTATVKMARQPLEKPNAVRTTQSIAWEKPIDRARLLVEISSDYTGFSGLLERPWRIVNDAPGKTTLRMVENDRALAQCDIRPLPNMKPGQQLTLEAFQVEIKRSLGDQFSEFLEAEEGLNGGELRTLRVAVLGAVQQVPVQWVFLHFSDDNGRRLGATFSLESSRVEKFAGSDAQLANSLHFEAIQDFRQATSEDTTPNR